MSNQNNLDGFLIKNDDGYFLSKGLFWFAHEKPEDAYVFHRDIFYAIRHMQWFGDLPHSAIPARYNRRTGEVTVTGDEFELQKEEIQPKSGRTGQD